MADEKKQLSFDLLPEDIQEWLSSELIAYEIGKIIDKLKIPENKEGVLALLIGRVIVKKIPAKQFVSELAKAWNIPLATAQIVGTDVKNGALKPIVASLWKNLQIDVADFTKLPEGPAIPAAREVKFERTESPAGAQGAQKPAVQAPAAKPAFSLPKAKVTEFAPFSDVRKPSSAKATEGRPTSPQPKIPAANVIEPPKPFGLSEVEPQAPVEPKKPHELTPYQDEHPMKE